MTIAASQSAIRQVFVGMDSRPGDRATDLDEGLREYLREWRRTAAKRENMPAFVVLHDTSLDEICRMKPSSVAGLRLVTGIGEKKAARYGEEILQAIRRYQEGARAALPEKKTAPMLETLQLIRAGKTLQEIATIRGRQLATIVNTVAELVERGDVEFSTGWIDPQKLSVIEAACASAGPKIERLKPLKDVLPPDISYEEIRLVVARNRCGQDRGKPEVQA